MISCRKPLAVEVGVVGVLKHAGNAEATIVSEFDYRYTRVTNLEFRAEFVVGNIEQS